MANNIIKRSNDDYEIFINTETGESFTSAKGYARLSGKEYSTIKSRINGTSFSEIWLEYPTKKGVRKGRVIPERIIARWIIRDNPIVAESSLMAGIRKYNHTMAGFNWERDRKIREDYPGIKILENSHIVDKELPDPFSVREFLAHNGILQKPDYFYKLTSAMSRAYRLTVQKNPGNKRCLITGDLVRCYEAKYQSLLDGCLKNLLGK